MAAIDFPNTPTDGDLYVNPQEPNVVYVYSASEDAWLFADNSIYRDAILFNGQPPSYYLDYNNFTNAPLLVTKTSELINDSGYIVTESDTLDDVTSRGATTANDIEVGAITVGGSISLSTVTALGTGSAIDLSLGNIFTSTPNSSPDFEYTFSNEPLSGFHKYTLFITPTITTDLIFPFSVLSDSGESLNCTAGTTTIFELFYNGNFYLNKLITNAS